MALTNPKIPPRFAMSDWHTSNTVIRTNAERQREASHQVRQEGRWLRNETDNHTRWTQHDSNTKLEKRIDDINDWRKSLERCLAETDHEIALLEVEKERTERALEAKKVPLDIALECLMLRENRLNIDLVRDEVEAQLHKEVEVIEGTKSLLQQKVDEAAEQLCLLQEARHQLHLDLTDKYTTLQIDGDCHSLNNLSANIGFQVNPTRTIKGSVTPETWDSFSNYNKLRAEAEMKASSHLREAIFATLQQTANDLEAQRKASEYAFRKRTHESQQAKSELEWQQKNTEKEIATLEGDIKELKYAIDAKNAPMMVAQTRLENRTYRPNVELCRDQAQYQLCHEVAEIGGSIRALIALENRCMNVREKMREIPHSMTMNHPFGPPIGNKEYSTMMNSLGQYTTTTKDTTQPEMRLPPETGGHFNPPTKQYTLPTGYTGSLRTVPETERKAPVPIAE